MDVRRFFYPNSILVYGVSNRPDNLGKNVIANFNRFGFKGSVYGFGREAMAIEGRSVYTDLQSLPEVPDLAIILVPAAAVLDAMERCSEAGIRCAVIETGGFAELGPEGGVLERKIKQLALENDMACMGPNCIGIVNKANGVCMPFFPIHPVELRRGRNAFITQSGGLVNEIERRCIAENVGISAISSIGNKLMIDESDILQFHMDDPETDVIGIYLESIGKGRRLIQLAAEGGKPVIVLKGNESPSARDIASFHTAAVLGDKDVMEAAFRQSGIQKVQSLQEMVDCFKVFRLPPIKGRKLALMTRSGGQCVLLADEAYRHGFEPAKLPADFFDMINDRSRGGVIRRTNPIDLGDVWDEIFYLKILKAVLEEDRVDGVGFFFGYPFNNQEVFNIVKRVADLCYQYEKPVVFCMVPERGNWFKLKDASDFPFFTEPERAFAALERSYAYHTHKKKSAGRWAFSEKIEDKGKNFFTGGTRDTLSVAETLSLVRAYGIPVVDYELVKTPEEASRAAGSMGYPVVLKQAAPLVVHKTDAGAVCLDIKDDEMLGRTVIRMNADLYLLQKQAPKGIELIIGGKMDPEFGPVVVFGLGGIFVEILKDVVVRIAPVDYETAMEMIHEIRGAALLKGARGRAEADLDALARVIVDTSRLVADHPEIINLDINPFRLFEKSKGGLALDVKIECLKSFLTP